MSDTGSTPASTSEVATERRSNDALRALVKEMLDRVRELNSHAAAWAPGERAQAESELEAIMKRVRREASHTPDNT
ncbi:MAG TPA: hypothetical protein VIQ74_14195 [Gemmatimonadaceae bacterium]